MPSRDERLAAEAAQDLRRNSCIQEAVTAGLKSGGSALAISCVLLYAMDHFSPAFRTKFTTGSKASFVALPVFWSFFYVTEVTVARCSAKRENPFLNRELLEAARQEARQEARLQQQ